VRTRAWCTEYRLVAKKGEGTFSEVLKAQSLVSGESYAIKCMKSAFKSLEQVNSLREIQALRRLNPHPNIIDLEEVLYDTQSGRLALVFELMDHNVYELIRGRKTHVKPATVKLLMYQLFKAVAHMHKHGIFHRDIKVSRQRRQQQQRTEYSAGGTLCGLSHAGSLGHGATAEQAAFLSSVGAVCELARSEVEPAHRPSTNARMCQSDSGVSASVRMLRCSVHLNFHPSPSRVLVSLFCASA
jgi:serine/threonine protein kinase